MAQVVLKTPVNIARNVGSVAQSPKTGGFWGFSMSFSTVVRVTEFCATRYNR
jgi:hypothetical protein